MGWGRFFFGNEQNKLKKSLQKFGRGENCVTARVPHPLNSRYLSYEDGTSYDGYDAIFFCSLFSSYTRQNTFI